MAKVLMLHRVLPQKQIIQPNAYYEFGTLISLEYLEKIIILLKRNNFEFVTVSELTDREGESNLIALTFDDGYLDNYTYVFPLLKKYNITATFFPVIEPCVNKSVLPLDIYYQCVDEMVIDKERRFDFIRGKTKREFYLSDPKKQIETLKKLFPHLPLKNRVSYLNTRHIIKLSENNFEIGSHGLTHSLLTANYMNKKRIIEELALSKQIIENIINKKVYSYCFPAGEYNSELIKLVKDVGYKSTCLISRKDNEVLALPSYERIFVKPNSLKELKFKLNII